MLLLGFGFVKTNVPRLSTEGVSGAIPVYCTAYGMTESEMSHVIIPSFPTPICTTTGRLRKRRFGNFFEIESRFYRS